MHSCYSRQSEWVEFQVKCSYCLTSRWQYWTTGNLFPLPQLSPIQDQVSALPLRPPKPSPAALTSTHAGVARGNYHGRGSRLQVYSPEDSLFPPPELWTQQVSPVSRRNLTSLECVLFWCLARSEALEKALLHPSCSQTYGFSPVWDLKCVFKFSSLE